MVTKVQQWGNSLGLRIPRAFANEAGVTAGSPVEVSVEGGSLIVRPLAAPKYKLSELLLGVRARNLHREIPAGAAVGREVW